VTVVPKPISLSISMWPLDEALALVSGAPKGSDVLGLLGGLTEEKVRANCCSEVIHFNLS
jgi:hypothetical protein